MMGELSAIGVAADQTWMLVRPSLYFGSAGS